MLRCFGAFVTSCLFAIATAVAGSSRGVSFLILLGSNSGRVNFLVAFCFRNNSSGVKKARSRLRAKSRSEQEKSFLRPRKVIQIF